MLWCSDNTYFHEEGSIKPSTTTAMMSQHIIKKLGLKPADFPKSITHSTKEQSCFWNNWNEQKPITIVMPAFLDDLPVNEVTEAMLNCAHQARSKRVAVSGVAYTQIRIFFEFHSREELVKQRHHYRMQKA